MDMKTYLSEQPDRLDTLAAAVGTKPVYLKQLASGFRKASFRMARKIDAATGGLVSVHDTRPDIYGDQR